MPKHILSELLETNPFEGLEEMVERVKREAIEKTLEMCMSRALELGMQDFINKQVTVETVLKELEKNEI